VTGRISDAREEGHVIDCRRGKDGRFHYWIREESQQLGWTA
jgi:hypothetical protein